MRIALTSLLFQLSLPHQALSKTTQLHALIVATHLSKDPFYATKILRFYAKNHELVSARQLFDQTPNKSVYLWNSMIRAYAREHEFSIAFPLFTRMLSSETTPDHFTFACMLRACAENSDATGAKCVHGIMITSGLATDSVPSTALVRAYSKLGLVNDAHIVFDGIVNPDLVSWNTILSGCGYQGLWIEGLELLCKMQNLGTKPDGYTMVALISCLCNSNLLEIGRGVHGLCSKNGFDSSIRVGSALVTMYFRCNSPTWAYQVFSEFSKPDLVMWSAMITGLSQLGKCEQALVVFSEMNEADKISDPVVIASVLAASAQLAMVGPGKEIHGYAFRRGIESTVVVASALIDLYSKCGFIALGLHVFELMPKRNVVTYNSMILGLGSHGLGHQAMIMFEQMLAKGFKPDEATFSAVFCACCHAGLVKEGKYLFRRMVQEFGIIPQMEHYVYMVKLLGVAGELEEAYNLILSMPTLPDSGVWGALLLGCGIHGNTTLSKIVARKLLETEPKKTAYKVMLSNIYAAEERWNDVRDMRNEMVEGGLRKEPARSWIYRVDSRI